YREARRLEPLAPETHYNVAITLDALGQPDEARASYRRALELRPSYAEAHNNLGNHLGRGGNLAEALHHLREAVRLKPDYPEAQSNLLLMLNYDPAIEAPVLFAEHC